MLGCPEAMITWKDSKYVDLMAQSKFIGATEYCYINKFLWNSIQYKAFCENTIYVLHTQTLY